MNLSGSPARLGLIGGLGVGATVHYYQEIARACAAQGRVAEIDIVHADVAQVLARVGQNDLKGLAAYLAGFARRLQAAESTFLALTAVAPHICAKELAALSPLPLVDMVEVTARHVRDAGLKRVALFGTRFAIETALFGRLRDVEIVRPAADVIDRVHQIYLQLVERGTGTPEQRDALETIAQNLIREQGAESIVLAGTDLTVLYGATPPAFPHVDCTRLHIDAIMAALAA